MEYTFQNIFLFTSLHNYYDFHFLLVTCTGPVNFKCEPIIAQLKPIVSRILMIFYWDK